MTHANAKVTIVILNWNGKDDTIECIRSLTHIKYPNYKILLVDNGSTDGSVECFKNRYHGIEIIENRENLGYAEGNNVGIRRAMERGVDYVFILNNDTIVSPDFLSELLVISKSDPKIGIIGPLIYYYEKPTIISSAGVILNHLSNNAIHLSMNKEKVNFGKTMDVDYIQGCAMLIKTEVLFKIGLFDPTYFAYWEEADLCARAHKIGYRITVVKKAKIWHKADSYLKNYSTTRNYYITRNRFIYYKKNGSNINKMFLLLCLPLEIMIRSFHLISKNKPKTFNAYIQGTIHGLKFFLNR